MYRVFIDKKCVSEAKTEEEAFKYVFNLKKLFGEDCLFVIHKKGDGVNDNK